MMIRGSIAGFLLALLMQAAAMAQVPGNGFENWDARAEFLPEHWFTLGNVSRSAEAVSGNFALRLENGENDGSFGVITNTPDFNLESGGQPYNEMPLSLRFRAKYNLSTGDAGVVSCLFKYKGNVIAWATVVLEGTSMDTFSRFSVPVDWQLSIQPDTVLFAVTSIDFFENQATSSTGPGYVLLDSMHFISISTPHAPIRNGGFENWTERVTYKPQGWVTTDDFIREELGFSGPFRLVERSTNAAEGSYSVQLRNWQSDDDILPGAMITALSLDRIEEPAFAVSQRWEYLNALYKFRPGTGDSATIVLAMFSNGQLIGGVQKRIESRADNWTALNERILYLGGAVPDSAYLIVSCADLDVPRSAETIMWIDALELSNNVVLSAENTIESHRFSLFPNPVTDRLQLNFPHDFKDARYQISDLSGRICASGALDTSHIQVDELPAGMYLLQVFNFSETHKAKFIKQ